MRIILPKNENHTNIPTNYYCLVDLSGSMYGHIKNLKDTLLAVKDLIGKDDTLSLAYFSSYGEFDWICKGASIKANNFQKLINEKVYARGLTCFTQILETVAQTQKDVSVLTGNNNSALYFLSDGYPNDRSPTNTILSLCSKLKDLFVTKTVVGYGPYYGRELLLQMADNLGGTMNHISDYKEMNTSYNTFFRSKVLRKEVQLSEKYDLVWQVSNNIEILTPNSENKVFAKDTADESCLYAINYSELPDIKNTPNINDARFVYSLAYMLSQRNKANLAVNLLRDAKDMQTAKMLQKAFTVTQKGRVENQLELLALSRTAVAQQECEKVTLLNEFMQNLSSNLGKISIDLEHSDYSAISKKGENKSKVEFTGDNTVPPVIVGITGNENRANISFLTKREGEITKVNDPELDVKIRTYNAQTTGKKIEFPIKTNTFRNYAFVANGDFNFKKIRLVAEEGHDLVLEPEKDLDIFESTQKNIHISEFTALCKSLIAEKAHASVLNFYIKNNSTQKHIDDQRVKLYGAEAVPLLEEMGLDYAMRYSPKKEYAPKDENADYITFLEFKAALKGASKISAKDSYEKYKKNGKQNPGDVICWPLFEKYDKMLASMKKEVAVKTLQTTLEGVDNTVDLLSRELSQMKFFLTSTNSWFDGIEKKDEFEYDGLVVKIEEAKEYL